MNLSLSLLLVGCGGSGGGNLVDDGSSGTRTSEAVLAAQGASRHSTVIVFNEMTPQNGQVMVQSDNPMELSASLPMDHCR